MLRLIMAMVLCFGAVKAAYSKPISITQLEPMSFEPTVGGARTVVYLEPTTSTNGVFLFRVSGDPNARVEVAVSGNEFSMVNSITGKTVVVKRFKYGCGLNKKGRIRLDGQGQSGVLCIGARAVVKASSQSGYFSVMVPFTVKYL